MMQVRRYGTVERARTNSLSTSYSRPQPFYHDDDDDGGDNVDDNDDDDDNCDDDGGNDNALCQKRIFVTLLQTIFAKENGKN